MATTEVLARLDALASAERIRQHAAGVSRQERACHKAAAEAYEIALALLVRPERCRSCGSDDICDWTIETHQPTSQGESDEKEGL